MAARLLNDHLSLGHRGENLVEAHLIRRGYLIHERNWRGGGGELDLVCSRNDILVFVEVRTRSSRFLRSPLLTINRAKQSRVSRAASSWLMDRTASYEGIRFDVVGVVLNDDESTIEHVENAFVPEWAY